jgi:hypothetical protein
VKWIDRSLGRRRKSPFKDPSKEGQIEGGKPRESAQRVNGLKWSTQKWLIPRSSSPLKRVPKSQSRGGGGRGKKRRRGRRGRSGGGEEAEDRKKRRRKDHWEGEGNCAMFVREKVWKEEEEERRRRKRRNGGRERRRRESRGDDQQPWHMMMPMFA